MSSFWSKSSKNKASTGRQTTLPTAHKEVDHTFGPMEIDPDTGLPNLPEGLAWLVSRSDSGQSVKVSVSENVEGYWRAFEPDIYLFTEPSSEALKNTTQIIYGRIVNAQLHTREVESVIGLYPPNSI